MKKRCIAIVLIALMLVVPTLSGCESENVKDARDAYEKQDYQSVVEHLENESRDDAEVEEMYEVSRAQLFISAGDLSEAYKCYFELGNQEFDEKANSLVVQAEELALESGNAEELIEMLKVNPAEGDAAVDFLFGKADSLNCDAFKCLDQVSASGASAELTEKCNSYLDSAESTRPKAWLIGIWEWQNDDETKEQVEIKANKDNLIGIVKVLGTTEAKYQIREFEIVWTDFEFMDSSSLTFNVLSKTTDGFPVDTTALVNIDYSNEDEMLQHITAPAPYSMVNADRSWKRIEQ